MNKNEELACDIATLFTKCYDVKLSKKALEKLAGFAETYTEEEMVNALRIAYKQYEDPVEAFIKYGGILYNRKKALNEYFE